MYLLENPFTYPYADSQLRQANLQTSFPKPMTDACRASFGMFPVIEVAKPVYDPYTQVCEEQTPVLVGNDWTQVWAVREMTATELLAVRTRLQEEIVRDTQTHMDEFAQTKRYDNMLSACTYATSSNVTFAAEGQYCVTQRDATWAALYAILDEVNAGTREMPKSFDEIKDELPVLDWAQVNYV